MKRTVYFADFADEFNRWADGRFSYEGLKIIFNFLEELEKDGEEIELDVGAVCSDFIEDTEEGIRFSYDIPEEETVIEFLEDKGAFIGKTSAGTIIYVYW